MHVTIPFHSVREEQPAEHKKEKQNCDGDDFKRHPYKMASRKTGRRREWVRRENDKREDAMKAHWIANVRERGVFRGRGQFIE